MKGDKKMARTYNAIKYVIKKNDDDLKLHGLRLYEFNIKDEKAINISKPIFVNRATLIEKIQSGEAFTRAFRVSQNNYYAGQSISLSINKMVILITILMLREMSLEISK